ncbi:DNA alkylation repair enzyme [hydrothermal vent metagenome]|uniref:DNA alkylation repair enzyme n=1 Tax=hydrothermal vent metagenome TaxID=652676 RepID=A0A3B0ZUR3_9ZZZZ
MPEPLKNLYTPALIDNLSTSIKKRYADFNTRHFKQYVFSPNWEQLELKQRLRHVTEGLHTFLPDSYTRALKILKPVSRNFTGFEYMFFPDYVELYGIDHFDESMIALEHFTRYSTSEMAVRPFIIKYPKKMMAQMLRWSRSDNYHVRRLSSEGCRPRLPWAMALPEFKHDPAPILKILERLKQDDSEYVRRSVANNLNDVSKDHPKLVLKIARQWHAKHPDTDWLVKHACRTLLKQGDPAAMRLFGLKKPSHVNLKSFKLDKTVKRGASLDFSFTLSTQEKKLGKLRIEYAVGFLRANGRLSEKVFKISETEYQDNNRDVNKSHSFKTISTRRYYPGKHSITIILNGNKLTRRYFHLK